MKKVCSILMPVRPGILFMAIGFANVFAVTIYDISEWWLLVALAVVLVDFLFIDLDCNWGGPIWRIEWKPHQPKEPKR